MASTKDPVLYGELASRSRVLHKVENPVARENVHDCLNVLRVKFQLQLGRALGRIRCGVCHWGSPLDGSGRSASERMQQTMRCHVYR